MDHRFRRRLRPVAIVVLVSFSWMTLEPWNYYAWAQSDSGAVRDAASQPKPKTATQSAAGGFEEILRATQETLDTLGTDLSQNQDTTLPLETLRGHRQTLEAADSEIRLEFSATEAFLKEKKLPAVIHKRQEETYQRYQKAHEQFLKDIDEINRLEAERQSAMRANDHTARKRVQERLQEKIKAVSEQLQKSTPKVRQISPRPESLPNRMREIKQPKTDKLSFKPLSDFLFQAAYAAEPPPVPGDLAETVEVQLTQEIRDLAAELDNNIVKIYEFVRNNFWYEPYVSSVKGTTQTLKERGGNEWDLASLLIALYRARSSLASSSVSRRIP